MRQVGAGNCCGALHGTPFRAAGKAPKRSRVGMAQLCCQCLPACSLRCDLRCDLRACLEAGCCCCEGAADGAAADQWAQLAPATDLMAAAPEDEILAEMLATQVGARLCLVFERVWVVGCAGGRWGEELVRWRCYLMNLLHARPGLPRCLPPLLAILSPNLLPCLPPHAFRVKKCIFLLKYT